MGKVISCFMFYVLQCFFVNKIVKKITGDVNSAKWAMFLLASSLFIYIGVYYGGQNDIVICAFATAAVYCLMDGRNKWFLFFGWYGYFCKNIFSLFHMLQLYYCLKKEF